MKKALISQLATLIMRPSEFYRRRGEGGGAGAPLTVSHVREALASETSVCLSVAASTTLRGAIEAGCRLEGIKKRKEKKSWPGNWKGNITVTGTITVVGIRLPLY